MSTNAAKTPTIGIILGDHAGIGPEITAMAMIREKHAEYATVLVGNLSLFQRSMKVLPDNREIEWTDISEDPYCKKEAGKVYFYNIPSYGDVPFSRVTAASGRLIYDSMQAMLRLEREKAVDGFVMGPITKQSLHAAGLDYASEFDIFSEFYQTSGIRAVIRAGDIFRCTVVGHVRFRDIVQKLTPKGVVDTAHALLEVMKRFHVKNETIAVAALNPHAGEDGLFGDEEQVILQPAIDTLTAEGCCVIGPCPADTVYRRAQTGKVGGIVFLYHDQGNIAMKAASFGDGVLIYTGVPARIVSVGHGGAFGSAGKGTADPSNLIAAMRTLADMILQEI